MPAWLNGWTACRGEQGRACASDSFPASRTELKGFGSGGTVAAGADGVDGCALAPRFTGKDVLRETQLRHLAVAPDGSTAVYARRTIEKGETASASGASR